MNKMHRMNRLFSLLLALAIMTGFIPAAAPAAEASGAPSASTSTNTANGVTLKQTAEWDSDIPGETAVRVTLDITSNLDLQSSSDVVFLIDRSITQPLDTWKRNAKSLASQLNVPGMRFALVTYQSAAEKVLDFTENLTGLNSAIDNIQLGYNCNCYAGLKEVQSLLEGRTDKTRPAYVVLFTNGRFNMNPNKMQILARQLDAVAPIFYTNDVELGAGRRLGDLWRIAAKVGESQTFSNVTVQVKLADGFALSSGSLSIAGSEATAPYDAASGTFRLSVYQKGQPMQAVLVGRLKNTAQTGEITAALEASISGAGLSVTTGAVAVTRSGYSVTYNGNGSATEAPKDGALYTAGSIVTVKPSSLQKEGWNFSGWVTDTGANIKDKFAINQNTTLNAAWGRAYVKLSSSTVSSNVKGSQMLNRLQINNLQGNAFYNSTYWNNLASVVLETGAQIPSDRVEQWDITDTSVDGNTPGAVMAWVVTNEENPSKFDLHISGKDGLTAPANCRDLFNGCTASTITGLDKLDTSNVANMYRMFYNCSNLTALNGISGWDTSKVTNMEEVFCNCIELASLDVSQWKTDAVTTMKSMFNKCQKLASLDVGQWKTDAVTTMEGMFSNCSVLTSLEVDNWETGAVTTMESMFYKCSALTSLKVDNWSTGAVTTMNYMFSSCSKLTSLTFGDGWNTSNVTDMSGMFYNCSALTELTFGTSWNTSKVTTMSSMFSGCSSLTELSLENGWNTSSVTTMLSMFYGCSSLRKLVFGSNWSTLNVTSMAQMFSSCRSLEELTFRSLWNTSKVTSMLNMFSGCASLSDLSAISNWNTSNVTDMAGTFNWCTSLSDLSAISNWNTSNVTSMSNMFHNCTGLMTLPGISNWNVEKVESMNALFADCSNLTSLDLSNWNMRSVTNLNTMFYNDAKLTNIGRTEITVANGCTRASWNYGANTALTSIKIIAANGDQLYPETRSASLSGDQPEEPEALLEEVDALPEEVEALLEETIEGSLPEGLPAETIPEEEAPQEPEVLTAAAMQSAAPPYLTDANGRPLYAKDKAGLWDCGTVQEEDIINYSLELQYLNEDGSANGVSGVLTVTNPIPEGLTLSGDPVISGPVWIDGRTGTAPSGEAPTKPTVNGNILTFTAEGLSAGAKFVVTYSCTVPAAGPNGRVFLNTASVDDGGIADYADPVLHTMNGAATYDVTFAYDASAPAGAAAASSFAGTYLAGTAITLPAPAVPGYTFNGWVQGGSDYPGGSTYTVNSNAAFTGSWTKINIPTVTVRYAFTGDLPDNEELIRSALLEGVPEKYPANATAAAPALAMVPTGYGFQWLSPVGADGQFDVGPGPEITVTGQWMKEKYSVTYQYDGGAPSGAPALPTAADYAWDSAVSLAPEPDGTDTHIFLGWTAADNRGNSVSVDADGRFQMPMEPVTVTGRWAARPAPAEQEVLIDPNGGVWQDSDEQQALPLADYEALVSAGNFPDARKDGEVFDRWTETAGTGAFAKLVTAQWQANEPQNPGTPDTPPVMLPTPGLPDARYFIITATAEDGGSILPEGEISVSQGAGRTFTITPEAGFAVLDVKVDGESVGAVESYTFRNVRQDHRIEARFAPVSAEGGGVKWLNTADHMAYLQGFPDGTFQPGGSMTRGEAAQMFYNLLLEREPAAAADFSDVPAGAWYEDAVNAFNALGVMHGDGRGRFFPQRAITRAEFAAVAVRFAGEAAESRTRFADVEEKDWFFAPVMSASALGWIAGYEGGLFRPDIPISRSEAAAIVNRMLNRSADRAYVDSRAGELRRFPDVAADHWAYYDILEASNGHDYYLDQGGAEVWRRLDGSLQMSAS